MKFFGDLQIIERKKRKLKYLRCDCCNTKIVNGDCYYDVSIGHHDWGNDSVDSMQNKEICESCINDFITTYLKNANGTEYIDIERSRFYESANFNEDYDEIHDELVENDN